MKQWGHINSVTGPVSLDSLKVVLPHEHLFIDLRNQFTEFIDPQKRAISKQDVDIRNLGLLRRNPYAVRDNLLIDDFDLVLSEVLHFKRLGGSAIVECTSVGIHRDVAKLRDLARRSGVTVIPGCGYYTHDTHPPEMDHWSVEDIAEQIIRDLTQGIDETGIRAGVIGELGTSASIHPNERKCLLAAAQAFGQVRVPIYVHTYPWAQTGLEAADVLLKDGVDPGKIVICHLDVQPDLGYVRSVLERGVWVEFDNFGKEFYIPPEDRGFAGGVFMRDIERVRLLQQIVAWGYKDQVLLTNDICLKSMLRAYGGWGYGHILENIVPMMMHEGLTHEIIDLLIRSNPRRLFA